jgi:hypothetical protein
MPDHETTGSKSGREVRRGPNPPKPYYDVDAETGCWNWNRGKMPTGYGTTRYNGHQTSAHRAYYAHYVEEIPAGMVVLHECDNPSCVNPEHLRMGTQRDNTIDRDWKGRNVPARGEGNGRHKLSDRAVLAIHELRRAGWIQRDIAEAFDVSQVQIHKILTGKQRPLPGAKFDG